MIGDRRMSAALFWGTNPTPRVARRDVADLLPVTGTAYCKSAQEVVCRMPVTRRRQV